MKTHKKKDTRRTEVFGFRVSHSEAADLRLVQTYERRALSKTIRSLVAIGLKQRLAEMSRAIGSQSEGRADAA